MDKRYHIHVCFASDDLVAERSIMMQKLASNCFFTWSLQDSKAVATNYSRQQIDACDYVIFLVGSQYGNLAASGVSYLHLDYIYANSKLKPMMAMVLLDTYADVDATPTSSNENIFNQRKLKDFRNNIINTCTNLYQFNSAADFANKLGLGFERLTEQHPSHGWVPNAPQKAPTSLTQYEMPAVDKSGEFAAFGIEKTELSDTLSFTYRVQAFKDGNFKELYIPQDMSWGQVLSIIADSYRMPASEDIIAKSLHEHLEKLALDHVHEIMPEAHAAARPTINSKDLQQIKLQLTANDWITTADYTAAGKRLMMLTPQGARQVTQWRGVMERLKA